MQTDQLLDRGPGPALGACLKPAAQQDQRDDGGGRLKVDLAGDGGQKGREKQCNGGIDKGGTRAQRHKAVHIGRTAQKRRDTDGIEPPAGPKDQDRGQGKLDHPAALMANRFANQSMHTGDHVRAHRQHDDGQRQHGSDGKGPPNFFGFLALYAGVILRGRLCRCRRRISRIGRGFGKRVNCQRPARVGHHCGIVGKVHADFGHARNSTQRLVDPRGTAAACHPRYGKCVYLIQRHVDCPCSVRFSYMQGTAGFNRCPTGY